RLTQQSNCSAAYGNGTGVKAYLSAQSKSKADHWANEIRASFFQSVIIRPIGPNLTTLFFNCKSCSVAIKKTNALAIGKRANSQVGLAMRVTRRASIEKAVWGNRKR